MPNTPVMDAGGYQGEQYWQTGLARRWLKGEDVGGGQFKTWLNHWKICKPGLMYA